MKNIDNKIMHLINEWNYKNPAMEPLKVPIGYDTNYLYKQPVICSKKKPENIPFICEFIIEDNVDVIVIELKHQLNLEEMTAYQNILENYGIICMGNLRLVKQEFFWAKNNRG